VDAVASQVTEGRDRDVRVVRQSDAPALVVAGDRKRLHDVVGSLLTAVLREQGGPGEVVVRTSVVHVAGAPWAALAIGLEETARFVLTNGGPDARLNEGRGGLGLALPVARRVIEGLEGRIWSTAAERSLGAVAVVLPLKEKRS
jgi:signal transduction histidine kinase